MMQLFDEVGEAFRSLAPDTLGELNVRPRAYGIKIWIGPEKQRHEHYEAQVIGPADVADAEILAIEVGFHAEHPDPARNELVLAKLIKQERRWRKVLGDEPVAGVFLGNADHWRRLSETWPDPNLGDPDLGFELAARLLDYLSAIDPLLRDTPSEPTRRYRR
jgi:hypothetical protein